MKLYEVSDFISLLRFGMWSGGKVVGIGYISAARKSENRSGLAGLTGHHLSNGIMLEKTQRGSYGETEMTFSVYDPYTGNHTFFEATATSREDVEDTLLSTIRSRFGSKRSKHFKVTRRGVYVTRYHLSGSGMEAYSKKIR